MTCVCNRLLAMSSVALLTSLAGPAAHADTFDDGDFYILTFDWPGLGAAVARIDPVTGDTAVLYDVISPPLNAQLTHDPWRDRIVTMPDTNSDVFEIIDADGTMTEMVNPWTHSNTLTTWAPVGDGRIYMVTNGLGYFGYMDADDLGHDLLDTDGKTPFFFTYGATNRENLIYDARTNSLFLVHFGAATEVTRFPLSADGTQLAAPAQSFFFDAFPKEFDEPMGLGAGPNGTLFVKIRTNTNFDGLRMFTVDPVTLQFASYAFIGHAFVAGNTAGIYNSTHDFAIAMDSGNNVIRSYIDSGSVQEVAIFATGVSDGGGGELTRIITIGDTINGYCPADTDGNGVVDVSDLIGVLAAWGSSDPTYDIAPPPVGDGTMNFLDLILILTNWGPC